MYSDIKKLSIIEEILKINNDSTLKALQDFLNLTKKAKSNGFHKKDFSEFSGIWGIEEAKEIEKIISESCEKIQSDDWE